MKKGLIFGLISLLMLGCRSKSTLATIIKEDPFLNNIAKNKKEFRLQIIYTRVHSNSIGKVTFQDFLFNVDTGLYFYPASTAKVVISALALEKIHTVFNDKITAATPLKAYAAGTCQTNEFNDSTSSDGKPSIEQYIKRMLLVSDNYAYNRVFDFLGQDYIQERLTALLDTNARIIQRLDPACNPDLNRAHNKFCFYPNDDTTRVILAQAKTSKVFQNPLNDVAVGNAYYFGDSLINSPKQFRFNNNLSLMNIHSSLEKIIFPDVFSESKQFHLESYDYRFLKKYLGMYPFESDFPKYDSSYFPAYKKYFYYGQDKNASIDSNLRIYNIVGQAYGFTTDAAFFSDSKNNITFFLSATIYTNKDGIINDNKYEYETIAQPFLMNLGRRVYQYEVRHKK